MIAVQMRQHDQFDLRRINTKLAEGHHAGGAKIDGETTMTVINDKAGLELSAAAKSITAASNLDLNAGPVGCG